MRLDTVLPSWVHEARSTKVGGKPYPPPPRIRIIVHFSCCYIYFSDFEYLFPQKFPSVEDHQLKVFSGLFAVVTGEKIDKG